MFTREDAVTIIQSSKFTNVYNYKITVDLLEHHNISKYVINWFRGDCLKIVVRDQTTWHLNRDNNADIMMYLKDVVEKLIKYNTWIKSNNACHLIRNIAGVDFSLDPLHEYFAKNFGTACINCMAHHIKNI